MIKLSPHQLDKLAEYFIDVAKGLTLAALAVPAVISSATILTSLKISIAGILFLYLSLQAIALKEVIS